MAVIYEWDVEEFTDDEHEDIVEHYFCNKFSEALAIRQAAPEDGCKRRVVLVRDDEERSWAYLQDDGKLPEFFENADGVECVRVPKKFAREVEAQANCHKCNGNSVTHSELCPQHTLAGEAAALDVWRSGADGRRCRAGGRSPV